MGPFHFPLHVSFDEKLVYKTRVLGNLKKYEICMIFGWKRLLLLILIFLGIFRDDERIHPRVFDF